MTRRLWRTLLGRHHRQRAWLGVGEFEISLVGVGPLIIQLVELITVLEVDRFPFNADRYGPRDDIRYRDRPGRITAEDVGGFKASLLTKGQLCSAPGDYLIDLY